MIEKKGILLVFPIQNKKVPPSLWSEFYPDSLMKWERDSEGDGRVGDLWHLREELSRSRKVVYTKWYNGRATFFSRELFVSALVVLRPGPSCSRTAEEILSLLELDSPLSTKTIKAEAGLRGKPFEREYVRAMKELWQRLLIVGFGEIDEGAFPSLAIGSTRVLYEELWEEADGLSVTRAWDRIRNHRGLDPSFLKKFSASLGD